MTEPTTPQPGVRLQTTFIWLMFLFFFFKPKVSVDGAPPVQVDWGQAFFALTPGPHRVNVWIDYMFFGAIGKAEIVAEVPAAGVLPLRYKAPAWLVTRPGKLTVDAVPAGGQPAGGPVPAAGAGGAVPPAPPAPAATSAPGGPQWDGQRNAWVQFDPAQQAWIQFDDASQQWVPIT